MERTLYTLGDVINTWVTTPAEEEVYKNMEATSLTNTLNERGKRYGKFTGHAEVTQAIKSVMFNSRPNLVLAADQREALEMIAHKIGRIINGDPDYADSWVDIAGYAQLVADRLNGVER
jgi:hypothetical protein